MPEMSFKGGFVVKGLRKNKILQGYGKGGKMMQNLISDRIRKKAETIIIIKEDETADRIYFKALWSAPNGLHEYKVAYKKDNNISLLDRFDCSCIFHSLNIEDFHFCGYSYAVFQELVKLGILNKALLCEDESI